MRTTIDLPDALLIRAKAEAAYRGVSLKDIMAAGLEKELASQRVPVRKGQNRPIPVRIEGVEWTFPHRTNADLFEAIEREDEGL